MAKSLPPDELAPRLAEVYVVLGPLYRSALRTVERDEHISGMPVGVRAVLDQLRQTGPAGLTVPQLARDQHLSRQFVQRMVNDAAGRGWVEPADNPAHRRSPLIRLTVHGRQAIGDVITREHQLLSRVGGELTAAELDTTLRVLHAMLAALNVGEHSAP